MRDGWHRYSDAFPGLHSDTHIDEVYFSEGKPIGRVEQFHADGSAYANGFRGRLGAFEDVAAAKEAIERTSLRVVK